MNELVEAEKNWTIHEDDKYIVRAHQDRGSEMYYSLHRVKTCKLFFLILFRYESLIEWGKKEIVEKEYKLLVKPELFPFSIPPPFDMGDDGNNFQKL